MKIPPHLKRRAVVQSGFCFSELSLSDAEVAQLCAIPSRRAAPAPLPECSGQRFAAAPPRRGHRPRRLARGAAAAGLALLALPSCTTFDPPALLGAGVEAVQLARAALTIQKKVLISAARPEAAARVEAPSQGRTPRGPTRIRPVPPVVDTALLVRADLALSAGQYRAALAMYRKLIARQPAKVEALFGAALASHELNQTRGSADYLTRALTLRPDHPLANVLAGFGAQLGRRYDDARARYSHFLEVEESGPAADEIRAVLSRLPQPVLTAALPPAP